VSESKPPHEQLIVADVAAWRAWLDANENDSDGVWLVLAKKGTQIPTTLSYAEALQEALCSGWIDGQRKSLNETTYLQRFTPRRKNSIWSQRNVDFISNLISAGRLRERGNKEVLEAQADGRWERTYSGPSSTEVPEDLLNALKASPKASEIFDSLTIGERYPSLIGIVTSAPDKRAAKITKWIEKLETANE